MEGLGSPQPHHIPPAPLHTGTQGAYNGAYTNGFGIGRQPPNLPLNSNGAPAFSPRPKWNPAALLNPRGFHSSPQQNLQNGFSSNSTASQLSFQFDSPTGTSEPIYHAHPSLLPSNGHSWESGMNGDGSAAYAIGNGNSPGAGHMLERMHNVTERGMLPQKRKRPEDSIDDSRRKAEFSGGSKGGVLGNYMREQREEGQKEARANGTAPVVTALDDDDEVEVVPNDDDKEVCYGRVEGAELNASKVPTPKPGATAISSGYLPQVKIVLRRRVGEKTIVIHAVDSTREIIGCVDVNTSIGLSPLLDSKYGIRTAARILTRPKREGDPPPGSPVSQRYGLDLNIYGPKKYAKSIGQHLSMKQLWLRTPLFVEAGVELHNPHAFQRPPQPPARGTGPSYGYRHQGPVRTTEEIRNDVLNLFDSLPRSENLQEMEPDPRITTELLRHQKQGLFFMINKEKERDFTQVDKSCCSLWQAKTLASGQKLFLNVITGQEERDSPPQVLGGILADMMGLGKTLSVLSLIVKTLDDARKWAQQTPRISKDKRDLGTTKTGKRALPTIEQAHLVQNCRTTLLVAPLTTIQNWEEQIKQHIKSGTLKYYVYHGTNRVKDIRKLAEYDLVITTYGSVASEFNCRSRKRAGTYPLEEINWFRIVLDEAHMIREQSTQQSIAICRLAANRRWAVTGTPVQNRLEDLGALIKFLRIKPFDEKGGFAQHIMAPFKMCDPEILPKLRLLVNSITLRRLKDRIDLPPRRDQLVKLDFSPEERAIYDIFAKNASDRVKVIVSQREKSLGGKSYVHILQSILRLRLICAHGRDLLGEEDLKVMEGLSKDSAIDLDSDEEEDRSGLSSKQAYDMYNLMKETNADVCVTCGRKIGPNDAVDPDGELKDEIIGYMTPCYHVICTTCIGRYKTQMEEVARGQAETSCQVCHQHIKLSYFPLKQGGIEDEEDSRKISKDNAKHGKDLGNYSGPHTKTRALINDLLANRRNSELKPNEPPIKSVIFSGWTAHLDLIQLALSEHGIKYTRLDGKMSRKARGDALDEFRDDPTIIVILVSITAGGLGLNLTTANKVYVMEPQYNPAAEAQAVDRVHRLGQKRPVETVRYIMNDSFEEKMLELQDKKNKLASLSMDGEGRSRMDKTEAARKRLEDLRSLFK
ncbi:SNF2 family helicase/ATPase-like protein [Hyaloscypha variabilis]